MSNFEDTLNQSIGNIIKLYITEVSKTYNLEYSELLKLWNTNSDSKLDNSDDLYKRYNKSQKMELVNLCKSKNIKHTGTKHVIIKRLIDHENGSQKSLKQNIKKAVVEIKRNKWNNYVHTDSDLVFNNTSQKVIGKQNSDGSISELTIDDINICKQLGFKFILPENLDSSKNDDDDDDEEPNKNNSDDEDDEIEIVDEDSDDDDDDDDDDNNDDNDDDE